MNQELKDAIKLINDKCKEITYSEYRKNLKSKKLDKIIWDIKGEFLSLVDVVTINYMKTQLYKNAPEEKKFDTRFKEIELTKGERERAIEVLQWFEQDIKACISHLKK